MKKALAILLCGCFLLTICSCNSNGELRTEFTAMNTLMSIRVFSCSNGERDSVIRAFEDKINELDALFDANNESSDVSKINGKKVEFKVIAIELLVPQPYLIAISLWHQRKLPYWLTKV